MKKVLSLFLALTMLLLMIPMAAIQVSASATAWDGSSYDVSWCTTGSDVTVDEVGYKVTGYAAGTEFIIDTPAKLAGIAKLVNLCSANSFENVTFKITQDLDLGDKPWTMIGLNGTKWDNHKFCGSLVGAKAGGENAVISHLYIDDKSESQIAVGLIAFYGGKEISNLTMVDSTVKSIYARCGAFVGSTNTTSTLFKNLVCDADIIMTASKNWGWNWVGGICGAGYALVSGAGNVFENCVFTGKVVNENNHGVGAGGILGVVEGKATFKNCISTGLVSACTSGSGDGSVKATGGILGLSRAASGSTSIEMTGCYVSSTIKGYQRVGGLLGDFWNPSTSLVMKFTDCQFDGTVISNGGDARGAFVGFTQKDGAIFTNCFNSGIASCIKSGVLTFALAYGSNAETFTNCYTLFTMQKNTSSAEDSNKITGSVPTAEQLGAEKWEDRTGSYPILKNASAIAATLPARDVSWFDPTAEEAFTLDNEAKLNGFAGLYASAGANYMKVYKYNVTCHKWDKDLFSAAFIEKMMVDSSNVGSTAQTKIVNGMTAQASKQIENGKYDVRIIAEIKTSELKTAEFHFTASYVDGDGNRVVAKVESRTVDCCYESLSATAGGSSAAIEPTEEGNYLIAFVISGIEAAKGDMTFSVSVCATDDNGSYCIASRAVTFEVGQTQVTPVAVA